MDQYSNGYRPEEEGFGGPTGSGSTGPQSSPVPYMAYASLIFSILSLFMLFFGTGFFFSAMGIIFALLSRKKAMETPAKVGLVISVVSLVICLLCILGTVYILIVTGTWDRILTALQNVDMTSANAYNDVMDIVSKELTDLLNNSLNSLGGLAL